MISSVIDLTQHYLLRPLSGFYSNKRLACSQAAGRWNFGNTNFNLFHNAIDLESFAFQEKIRMEIRSRYQLKDKLVIGFAGMLRPVKNPEFLLDILSIINKKCGNAVLVLLGDGELGDALKSKAREMDLNNVLFLGRVDNVHEWMQAFDVMLLPSRNEGLPMVLIEAQTSGLTCIASDGVPQEAAITDRLSYLSTRGANAPESWANRILSADFSYDRRKYRAEVAAAGFDIRENARRLENIYDELLSRKQP